MHVESRHGGLCWSEPTKLWFGLNHLLRNMSVSFAAWGDVFSPVSFYLRPSAGWCWTLSDKIISECFCWQRLPADLQKKQIVNAKMAPFRVQWKSPPWPIRQNFSSLWIYFLVYHKFLVNPQTLQCDEITFLKPPHSRKSHNWPWQTCLLQIIFGPQEEFLLQHQEWLLWNLKWGWAALSVAVRRKH